MNTGIIASRYADALLKYVEETGDGQVVYRQACTLADALSASGEFERLVESKTLLTSSGKVELMSKSLGNEDMCPSLSKFLELVIRQGAVSALYPSLFQGTLAFCARRESGYTCGKYAFSGA